MPEYMAPEMEFVMEINLGSEAEPRWSAVKAVHEKGPYKYETAAEAAKMLDICYPDQTRAERLSGIYAPYFEGKMVRINTLEPEDSNS